MGAAWRAPTDRDLDGVVQMIEVVREQGLETCVTLGMLSSEQAKRLADCGLDYYNHNLDTSPEFYGEIITTRTYRDRLETLQHVRGRRHPRGVLWWRLLGMGESRGRTVPAWLFQLATQGAASESRFRFNLLIRVPGTPLGESEALDPLEFVRTIAAARITMPYSMVRLSAGREDMTDELQALCFVAGANSIFYGEILLTTPNPDTARDQALFSRLGLTAQPNSSSAS